jgi:hypothetical protein
MEQDNNNEENGIDEQYLMSIMAGSPKKKFLYKMQIPKNREL